MKRHGDNNIRAHHGPSPLEPLTIRDSDGLPLASPLSRSARISYPDPSPTCSRTPFPPATLRRLRSHSSRPRPWPLQASIFDVIPSSTEARYEGWRNTSPIRARQSVSGCQSSGPSLGVVWGAFRASSMLLHTQSHELRRKETVPARDQQSLESCPMQ